jgi:NAD(P)H-hydrate epimerase
VIARQLHTRVHPAALHVVFTGNAVELKGDAAINYRMLEACGCPVLDHLLPEMHAATIVVDALLGTGLTGPATGGALELIRAINSGFPVAEVVSVDIPSGLPSDDADCTGEYVLPDYTVTFTAPKVAQAISPNCDRMGELHVAPIGSPPELYEADESIWLALSDSADFADLLAPREPAGHKGTYGHVLVIGGASGKTGAAAMAGLAALRSGAGLVTVASAGGAVLPPEIMTEPPPGNWSGKDVVAIGPGLGREETQLVTRVWSEFEGPLVVDADALAAMPLPRPEGRLRVLTPHPGEMSRLTGKSSVDIQYDRVGTARAYAFEHGVVLVLKGQRTVIAAPDGRVWINPTGTPALGTGGTGDVLTGMIAGLLAQFPWDPLDTIRAAVYLHGLAGQLGAAELGDKCLIATDVLDFLPDAIREISD